jgi:ribosome-associated protein
MKTKGTDSRALLKLCCQALWEKKAEDLRILDVGEASSITDYLVLATGTSEPHLRALRSELELVLKSSGTRLVGLETAEQSGWTVVDAFDVMVHLFTPEQREHYGLENLWKDAIPVPLTDFVPAPPAPEPVVAAVVPAKPKAKAKPKPRPKAKAKAKTKAKLKPKAKPKPKKKAQAKAKPKTKAKTKAKAKPAKRRA